MARQVSNENVLIAKKVVEKEEQRARLMAEQAKFESLDAELKQMRMTKKMSKGKK